MPRASTSGVDVLSQEDFNQLSRRVPVLVNMRPFGEYSMVDVDAKGGLQVIVRELLEAGFLEGGAMTCTGETLAEQVARLAPPPPDSDVIYPVAKPFKDTGGLRLLRGNLAPEGGAILKIAGVEGGVKNGAFTGRARVFNGERSLIEALDQHPDSFEDNDMVVIRYEGPRGAPGMPELLDPTSRITALCRQRHITIALMTDARFSGGSVGLVIGHVAPEALLGGPIALVEDGDTIVVDLTTDRLDCLELTDPDRSERRRAGLAGGGGGNGGVHPGRGAGDRPGPGPDAGDRAARPPRRRHGHAAADLRPPACRRSRAGRADEAEARRAGRGCPRAAAMPQCTGDAGAQRPSRDSGTRNVGARATSTTRAYSTSRLRGVVSISGPIRPTTRDHTTNRGATMKLTGAQALIKSLEMQGVDVMFGLPGGAILPVYDPIIDSSIRHILVRHEQGAGHMAEGYAMVTGRPGVAMVTSGPGATNIVTPLANAYMDSTPLVVVSGQVATASIGTDAFQECDITGVTMGITKHNWLIKNVDDIPRVVAAAFHVATTGRPGPGPHRPAQGHFERDHGVVLALLGRRARPAGLPPRDLRRPRAGAPGGGADRARPSARSSTSAAAPSRRGRPSRCGRWPNAPASRS